MHIALILYTWYIQIDFETIATGRVSVVCLPCPMQRSFCPLDDRCWTCAYPLCKKSHHIKVINIYFCVWIVSMRALGLLSTLSGNIWRVTGRIGENRNDESGEPGRWAREAETRVTTRRAFWSMWDYLSYNRSAIVTNTKIIEYSMFLKQICRPDVKGTTLNKRIYVARWRGGRGGKRVTHNITSIENLEILC